MKEFCQKVKEGIATKLKMTIAAGGLVALLSGCTLLPKEKETYSEPVDTYNHYENPMPAYTIGSESF